MLFATISVFAAMALSGAAGPNGRTFAVNHFYGKGPLTSGCMDPIVVLSSQEKMTLFPKGA